MLARIAYSTYFGGIGASGLYGIYATNKDIIAKKKTTQYEKFDDSMDEFIQYSAKCGTGFIYGLFCGVVWPVSIIGKTFSMISDLDGITRNN